MELHYWNWNYNTIGITNGRSKYDRFLSHKEENQYQLPDVKNGQKWVPLFAPTKQGKELEFHLNIFEEPLEEMSNLRSKVQ